MVNGQFLLFLTAQTPVIIFFTEGYPFISRKCSAVCAFPMLSQRLYQGVKCAVFLFVLRCFSAIFFWILCITLVKISAPVRKAILNALSERDATADICFDQDGKPEPDAELRDYENVPLGQDVHDFFAREVLPHVPDAWINTQVRDALDGEVGKVGYEINFNRYFYQYQPPRALEEIEADIKLLEKEILEMLRA